MQVGGKRTLTIPPSMAYGNKQVPDIPAGSTLIFGNVFFVAYLLKLIVIHIIRMQASRDQVSSGYGTFVGRCHIATCGKHEKYSIFVVTVSKNVTFLALNKYESMLELPQPLCRRRSQIICFCLTP
jgi:hypothetical protein